LSRAGAVPPGRGRNPGAKAGTDSSGPPLSLNLVRVLFFLSGASALAYEVIWTKYLTLVIGVTTFCVSTVVASFLLGLAIGSLAFGRRIDRGSRPLRLYAWLEVGVAAAALLFYFLLPGLEGVYVVLHRQLASSLAAIRLVRVVFCFLSLLPPTILMGGTLPVLCRREVEGGEGIGSSLAALYALNTLGGAAGTLVTGFVLIERLGLTGALLAAVCTNLAAAAVAFALEARERRSDGLGGPSPALAKRREGVPDRGGPDLTPRGRRVILAASALSGFAALAYEVIWTRALGIFLRSGIVYSFTLMLATFLLGIVLGSWIYRRILEPRRPGVLTFSLLETAIGSWGLLSLPLMTRVPLLPPWVARSVAIGEYSWGEWTIVWLTASAGILLVPATLMGILFPLAGRLVVARGKVGGGVGALYASNTAGSVVGAAATGFLLIPKLGTLECLRGVSLLSLAVAAFPILAIPGWRSLFRSRLRPALCLAAVVAVALSAGALPADLLRSSLVAARGGRNLYFAEGAAGVVEVSERRGVAGNSYKKLYFNGTSYAGTTQNARRYHRLLGHLPALLHPDPREGLVVGFGSGMTFGAMLLDPRIQRVDCAELSSEVLGAARIFAPDNGHALENPKGRIILGDGREHLLVTEERYDLISLEPPPPRFAGVVNLYSVDFYRLCRSRLRPGGLMAQWIPMHSHTIEEMRNLIRSFVDVFPEATFWAPTPRDGILVGSAEPIRVGVGELRSRMAMEPVASDLRSIDVPDLGALLGSLLLDASALAAYVRDARPITDDHPTIEYFGSFDLYEHPGHLEDVFRRGVNPVDWLRSAGGGAEPLLTRDEVRHLQAMQQLLLGAIAGDRGDLEGKRRAFAAALQLHPESIFLRRLNGVTGGGEE